MKAQSSLSYVYNNRDDISTGFADSGLKPYPWNNGILYLGYCFDSTFSREGTTITFYDTLGNLNWKKVYFYDSTINFIGYDIIALNNSSFYIVGGVNKDTINEFDSFFAKFNSNGDSLFVKTYPTLTNDAIIDIENFTSDTLLALNPLQINYGDEYSQIKLCKLDTFGNIFSSYTDVLSLKSAWQIVKDNNGKIYVGGNIKSNPGSSFYLSVFINVYSNNLNPITSWYPSLTIDEYIQGLNIWNNNLYLTSAVTVYDPPNPNAFYQCRVGKINPLSGGYSSFTNIGALNFTLAARQPSIINDNSIAVAVLGGTQDTLYLLDSIPNLVCQSHIEFSPSIGQQTMGIATLPNKKIAGTGILVGSATETQDHWNFLTENMETYLLLNCSLTAIEETEKLNLSSYLVYPTLFNEIINIKCIDYCTTKFRATLLNNIGQEIISVEGNNELFLNPNNISNGMYFLRISDNKRTNIFKLVKTD